MLFTQPFIRTFALVIGLFSLFHVTNISAEPTTPLSVGIVNFKRAIENSRAGKHEQETFEAMKTQMESILSEKEKTLNELAKQLNDPDYIDSLSPEAEQEFTEKFQMLGQEFSQVQNQYYQGLQQANMKILQKLAGAISQASESIALEKGLTVILNEENCFYFSDSLDVTDEVISHMDRNWALERKK